MFEPFAAVKVGNQTTYSASRDVSSGGTAYLNIDYYVNVPDDQTNIPITVEVWDYDGFQGNGNPDDTHERFAVSGTSLTWTFNHPLATTGPQPYSSSGSGSFRAEQVSLTVETLYPYRMRAYMVIPLDYSPIYNVTNATGSLVSRRYVGEPRLVPIVLNVTRVIPRATLRYQEVFFLPRSVFFDTLLYKRLANQDTSWPLTNLVFRQNLTSASSNSDELPMIISGNVTGYEEDKILWLMKVNATAATHNTLVYAETGGSGGAPFLDTLFMFTLPDGALRLYGYTPFTASSSVGYRFCSSPNCGVNPTPPTIWEQIWNGIVSTVTGWIVSAIVIALNAFAKLVEVMAQVGSWLADQFSQLPAKVASAVKAAGELLNQLVEWAKALIAGMVAALLSPFYQAFRNEGFRLTASADIGGSVHDTAGGKDFLLSIWDLIGSGNFFNVVVALTLALQVVAAIAVNVILPGSGSLIAKVIETVVMSFLVAALISGLVFLLLQGLDAALKSIIPQGDRFWAEGAGLDVMAAVADVSSLIVGWEKAAKPGVSVFKTLKKLDAAWLALSLAGLAITI